MRLLSLVTTVSPLPQGQVITQVILQVYFCLPHSRLEAGVQKREELIVFSMIEGISANHAYKEKQE